MTSLHKAVRLSALLAAFLVVFGIHAKAQNPDRIPAATVPQEHLIQPETLSQQLSTTYKGELILQVGSRVQFDQAHIPGSEYAGLASSPAGLETLRSRVKDLPHDKEFIIYCGCCPWERCPNIGAAWKLLTGMGFTNVKVLYIASSFGKDWVDHGFSNEATK